MKTGFYFMLKALFVVKMITSCPDFSVMLVERLVKKAMVKFKNYDVSEQQYTNCSIVKSKDNHAMKFII